MKKLLSIVAVFFLCGFLSGQVTPTDRALTKSMVKVADDIGDFTITDSDGVTWNLYDELSLGKTVFLDLFFST